jgi:hypothetical protein
MEGYKLLSSEYKNAKSNLGVLYPCGHEWTTNISNFDSGRWCRTCSKRKKYSLQEVKSIFAEIGYTVQDSIYINGKTPIKVLCPNGNETEVNLNNFMNGRRCSVCGRRSAIEARMKKLELKANSMEGVPQREASCSLGATGVVVRKSKRQCLGLKL